MGWVLVFGTVEQRVALLKINVIGWQPLGIWCGVLESGSGPHRPESRPGRAVAWSEKGELTRVFRRLRKPPGGFRRLALEGQVFQRFSEVF